MKRAALIALFLAGAFALLYGLGRPPSRYVLEERAAKLQSQRREQYVLLSREIARAAIAKANTKPLRAKLDATMLSNYEARLGGWDVLLAPPGAPVSQSDGWRIWGELEPWEQFDSQPMRGTWRVRVRPVTAPARLMASLGLGP